jgi:hypothetical protein
MQGRNLGPSSSNLLLATEGPSVQLLYNLVLRTVFSAMAAMVKAVTGALRKLIYIPQKMFIPQTRLNLVCGIFLFWENIRPISPLFLFSNEIFGPTVKSPNAHCIIILFSYYRTVYSAPDPVCPSSRPPSEIWSCQPPKFNLTYWDLLLGSLSCLCQQ